MWDARRFGVIRQYEDHPGQPERQRAHSMGHHVESQSAKWDASKNGGNGVWDRVGAAKECSTTSGEE